MSTSVEAQTLLPSKSGEGESIYKLCKSTNILRTSLANIETGIQVALVKSRTSRPVPEKEQIRRPLHESEKEKLARDREALVSGFETSRFLKGKLLWEYREGYRGSKGPWMQAVQAIANSDGVHSNTIRNLISDYEFAKCLPETARSALTDQGIDAARMKNRVVVEIVADRLQSEPKEPSPEQARQIVAQVVAQKVKRVKVKPDPYVKPDLDETLNYDEERIHRIRKAVREAVEYVSTFKRLEVVIEALEQEMYMVWGERFQRVIVLYPHSSAISLDGRKIKSDDREEGVA